MVCAGEAGGEVRLEGISGKGVLGGGEVGGIAPSEAINVWLPVMLGVGGFELLGDVAPDPGAEPEGTGGSGVVGAE